MKPQLVSMWSPLQPLAVLLVAAFATQTTACAQLPTSHTPATGEPLSVRAERKTGEEQIEEKVGEVEHKDARGNTVGSSAVYANRTHRFTYDVWKGYQGERPIDDADFLRIAGDKAGADEIRRSRETGVTMNHIGIGVLLTGAACVIAGLAVQPGAGAPPDDPRGAIAGGLVWGGATAALVGGLVTYFGRAKATREHPLDEPDRFRQAAAAHGAAQLTSATVPR